MEYNFYNFDTSNFEHLVQSLTQKLLGNNSIVYGIGPDGGRELTYYGAARFINHHTEWNGYWVVQAKFKVRDFAKEDSYTWVAGNLKTEILNFKKAERRVPDNYIFITNAVLSPVLNTGGRDKIENLKKEFSGFISNIAIISYDELSRLIDNNADVRTAYKHLLTPGDVMQEILERIHLKREETIAAGNEIREKKIVSDQNRDFRRRAPILAIDFGTSYSIAALVTEQSNVEFIRSDKGQILVPSSVTFFKEGNYIIGRPEYSAFDSGEQLTINNIKRDLSTNKIYSFQKSTYTPEFISSLIVKSIITNAEEYLGCEIKEVLITRPANYNIRQTNCLINIFQSLGLTIRRIIEEPSSACLLYPETLVENYEVDPSGSDIFITIDLGGGTFDIAFVMYGDDCFEIHAVSGDNYLGGIDFDTSIYNYLLGELGKKVNNINQFQRIRLKYESERVKKELGNNATATAILNDVELPDGNLQDISIELSKEKFIELTDKLNRRIEECIRKMFNREDLFYYAGGSIKDIKKVLLTGQGTKIFTVKKIIEDIFQGIPIIDKYSENAVILGSASYTGVLSGLNRKALLINICTAGIAVKCKAISTGDSEEQEIDAIISNKEDENGEYLMLIEERTKIPAKRTSDIEIDNGDSKIGIGFELFEFNSSNNDFESLGIAEIPLGKESKKMKIVCEIDANSTVIVYFKDILSDRTWYYQLNNYGIKPQMGPYNKDVMFLVKQE